MANDTVAPTRYEVLAVIEAESHGALTSQQAMLWAERYDSKNGHYPSLEQVRTVVRDFNNS